MWQAFSPAFAVPRAALPLSHAMPDIDLRNLPSDEFVLHFGGRPNEVDAFTFSNSLIAIAEALQEINRQI
jgi:hypothetical protein